MNQLQDFDKDFIMDLFLDTDSVSTMNRLVVSVANVLHENNDNICMLNQILEKQIDCSAPDLQTEPRPPATRRRIKHFYERTIMNYTDIEYEEQFKMKRSTVQALIDYLKDRVKTSGNIVSLEKKVHVFLWLVTTDCSYNEVGALFDLHKSSVSYILHEVATLIAEQQYNFISWPTNEEQHTIRIKVHSRLKFPNCVGFIDACHLKIGSKRNKKDEPETILLQAVCDDSLIFTDIYIGAIGKTRKNKVFKDSPLSDELKNCVDFENHILGNSEYKLRKNLITPYSSEELLTSEEMKFNETHWKTRAYIGRAFELLKERFHKLNHIDIIKIDTIIAVIQAACNLHNFIIVQEGLQNEDNIKEETVSCDDGVTIDPYLVTTAAEKRQFLCNYVNYISSI